ncbi:MAG: hypothetical protein ACP6IY_20560 [Promethearchaeia archaeon]
MSELAQIFQNVDESDILKKVVEELLNDNNLETKTELERPLRWSCIKMVQEYIEDHNLKQSNKILNNFIDVSFHYLISKKRQGRKEYIEALKSLSHLQEDQKPVNDSLNVLKS